MITYSRAKLSVFYTLSRAKLLKNYTHHRGSSLAGRLRESSPGELRLYLRAGIVQ